MTTSKKQLAANRNNAIKGGVKTPQGKSVSRYNAQKHGLLSKEVLLEGEDQLSLEKLCQDLRKDLSPSNQLEFILVDRIAANTWRLRRAMLVEKQLIEDECEPSYEAPRSIGQAFNHSSGQSDAFNKFVRYEASIERGIYKALHELQRVQATRKGEAVSAPLAIDIDGNADG